ncbi:hypothetical protein BC628DRAFT_416481 [Trametes gibbosa]|nr:hypothetical protein BC628DRAFT_416481 [Trametes gibbosa]
MRWDVMLISAGGRITLYARILVSTRSEQVNPTVQGRLTGERTVGEENIPPAMHLPFIKMSESALIMSDSLCDLMQPWGERAAGDDYSGHGNVDTDTLATYRICRLNTQSRIQIRLVDRYTYASRVVARRLPTRASGGNSIATDG